LEPHGHSLDTLVVLHRDDTRFERVRTFVRPQPDVIVVLERQCRPENRVLATAELHYDGFAKLGVSQAICDDVCRNRNRLNHSKELRELRCTALNAFDNRRVADRFHAVLLTCARRNPASMETPDEQVPARTQRPEAMNARQTPNC